MLRQFKIYCRESSIHGLHYLVNDNIHYTGKVFWFFVLITSVLCSAAMIIKIALKVDEHEIVTFTSDEAISITKIPFVAVTLCPDLLTHNEFFDYNRTKNALIKNEITIKNVTLDELKYMQAIALILNDDFLLQFKISIETEDILTFIKNLTFRWEKNANTAHFDDKYRVPFAEIIGPYGFCYTFNIIEPNELFNLEILPSNFNFSRPIEKFTMIKKYMRRSVPFNKFGKKFPASLTHYRSGFFFINPLLDWSDLDQLETNSHESQIEFGSHFIFHSPYEVFSKSSIQYRSRVQFSQQYFIEPKLRIIDESLEDAEPTKRGCYFENEKQLRFFRTTTENNCKSECLANKTLEACDCVQFFMVRENKTRICGVTDIKCFKNIEQLEQQKDSCSCLAYCDELSFKIEQRQMELVRFKGFQTFDYMGATLPSQILVFFKSPEFFPLIYKRSFTLLDLVSYTGGTLGLFLGFSVISFLEIVYYFSVRAVFEKLRRGKVADQSHQTENEQKNNFIKNFLMKSSIHGFNQVAQNRRSILERLLWLILVVTSLIYSVLAAQDIYSKYINSKILLSLDDNSELQKKIPFPAITFNNEIIFDRSYKYTIFYMMFRNYPDRMILYHLKADGTYEDLLMKGFLVKQSYLMEIHFHRFNASGIENYAQKIKNLSEADWFETQTAEWNSRYQVEFIQIPTQQGFGFSFNMLPPSKLFTERISRDFVDNRMMTLRSNNKNAINISSDQYPLRASNEEGNGLKLILRKNSRILPNDIGKYLTFTVHSPFDLASSYDEIETCEFYFGYDLDILITPEVTYTDPDLRSYDPKERNCYFPGEKKLKFFKVYTRKNCEFECLADFLASFRHVKCIPFYAVREESDFVCDMRQQLNVTFYKYRIELDEFKDLTSCECLEECDSVKYKFEIIANVLADFDERDASSQHNRTLTLNFKMKDEYIVPLRRFQPFTFNEFIAQSGGLMGLFAAVSALSIIEIFYFFPLRLITNLCRKFKKRN